MRGVEGDVAKPWLLGRSLDELNRRVGEQIGHIASRFHGPSVVDDLVGIVVFVDVSLVMAQEFVESSVLRLIRGVSTEVPFSKTASAIPYRLQLFGDRDFVDA